jgi:hypothetical protein
MRAERYEVVGVCREQSVEKLDAFKERITLVPGATDDRDVIKQAVAGCDGVLVVLVPRRVHDYSSGTAQAVLGRAQPGARLVFSSGWHITRDGQDVYSWKLRLFLKVVTRLHDSFATRTSTTRWRRASGCLQATRSGPSCEGATLKRARVMACPCGAATWATRSSRATSRAA